MCCYLIHGLSSINTVMLHVSNCLNGKGFWVSLVLKVQSGNTFPNPKKSTAKERSYEPLALTQYLYKSTSLVCSGYINVLTLLLDYPTNIMECLLSVLTYCTLSL